MYRSVLCCLLFGRSCSEFSFDHLCKNKFDPHDPATGELPRSSSIQKQVLGGHHDTTCTADKSKVVGELSITRIPSSALAVGKYRHHLSSASSIRSKRMSSIVSFVPLTLVYAILAPTSATVAAALGGVNQDTTIFNGEALLRSGRTGRKISRTAVGELMRTHLGRIIRGSPLVEELQARTSDDSFEHEYDAYIRSFEQDPLAPANRTNGPPVSAVDGNSITALEQEQRLSPSVLEDESSPPPTGCGRSSKMAPRRWLLEDGSSPPVLLEDGSSKLVHRQLLLCLRATRRRVPRRASVDRRHHAPHGTRLMALVTRCCPRLVPRFPKRKR